MSCRVTILGVSLLLSGVDQILAKTDRVMQNKVLNLLTKKQNSCSLRIPCTLLYSMSLFHNHWLPTPDEAIRKTSSDITLQEAKTSHTHANTNADCMGLYLQCHYTQICKCSHTPIYIYADSHTHTHMGNFIQLS